MPTNPNMVAIQTVTVGSGGAANIEFTNIPQTYTDLVILHSTRQNAGNAPSLLIKFNGSTSNFSTRYLIGSGSAASSGTSPANYAGNSDGSSNTASTFSNGQIYIPNYTSSNYKSYSIDDVQENNATEAYATLIAGLWSNTSAITSITLYNSSNSFVQYSTATLYGVTSAATAAYATGGFITSDANYFYHTFTSSGTFTPKQNLTCDYLVVAGGASGGTNVGGGGGAGGLRCTVGATGGGGSLESPLSLTAQAYTVTIGAGGAGQTTFGGNGNSGSNSVFSTITSTGGGFGNSGGGTAGSGGSGGGGSGDAGTGGAGTTNQGYAGGTGKSGGSYVGAGGGGAGAVGQTPATNTSAVGNGGNGVATTISGTSTYYAGGGGGARDAVSSQGSGGLGGGGNATYGGTSVAGTANTGGGGGGNHNGSGSGNGGSGIVIVRYAK